MLAYLHFPCGIRGHPSRVFVNCFSCIFEHSEGVEVDVIRDQRVLQHGSQYIDGVLVVEDCRTFCRDRSWYSVAFPGWPLRQNLDSIAKGLSSLE